MSQGARGPGRPRPRSALPPLRSVLLLLALCRGCGRPPPAGPLDAAAASCSDGIVNGRETGVDCGGPDCPACSDGQGCRVASDCAGHACRSAVCSSRRALGFRAPLDYVAGMPLTHPGFPQQQSIVAADLDGDGAVDLAVPSSEGVALYVLFGDGKGGFAERLRLPTKGRPTRVVAGDFDGDGVADLVAGYDGTALTFVRGGGRRLHLPADHEWPDGTYSLCAGDFNRDGHLDIAAAPLSGAAVTIGSGDGHGGFVATSAFALGGASASFLAAGDLDGDGRTDLVLSEPWELFDVLLGRDGPRLERSQTYRAEGSTIDASAIADLDGDGHADVLAQVSASGPTVLPGDGAGHLAARRPALPLTGHADAAALADLDLDGNLDAVLAADDQATVWVLLGDGRGGFARAPDLVTTGVALGLAVADLDGDGLPDIAVAQDQPGAAGPSGGVRVFLNASR